MFAKLPRGPPPHFNKVFKQLTARSKTSITQTALFMHSTKTSYFHIYHK